MHKSTVGNPKNGGNVHSEESVTTLDPNSIPTKGMTLSKLNVKSRKENVTLVRKLG